MAWYTDLAEVRIGGTKGREGTPDSSVLYMYNNKFYLYITQLPQEKVLLFHPYLKSINYSLDTKLEIQIILL